MSVFYNLSQLQASETVSAVFIYANDMSQTILAGAFLFAIFFILLMAMKRFEFAKALLSSTFACFILSLFLKSTGAIGFFLVILFGTGFAFTVFYVFFTKKGGSTW